MGHVIDDDLPHFNKTGINLLPRNNVHIRLCDDLLSYISLFLYPICEYYLDIYIYCIYTQENHTEEMTNAVIFKKCEQKN